MKSKSNIPLPTVARILVTLGGNLRLARQRRRISANLMAKRAGIARSTLQLIETGSPGAALSAFLSVLFILGLEKELERIGADDPLGRALLEAGVVKNEKT